jgi:hypothetical protein
MFTVFCCKVKKNQRMALSYLYHSFSFLSILPKTSGFQVFLGLFQTNYYHKATDISQA